MPALTTALLADAERLADLLLILDEGAAEAAAHEHVAMPGW